MPFIFKSSLSEQVGSKGRFTWKMVVVYLAVYLASIFTFNDILQSINWCHILDVSCMIYELANCSRFFCTHCLYRNHLICYWVGWSYIRLFIFADALLHNLCSFVIKILTFVLHSLVGLFSENLAYLESR